MTSFDHEYSLLCLDAEQEDALRDAEEDAPFDSHLHGDTLDPEIAALLPPETECRDTISAENTSRFAGLYDPHEGMEGLKNDLRTLLKAEREKAGFA